MLESIERLGRFAARVGRRFIDDGCATLAGSLTYTTLLALVPLLTIALTLITAFPVFEQLVEGVDEFVARNMLPPAVAQTVTGAIQEFAANAAELTAAGIAFLALTAILLMATIERAFAGIWRADRPRPLATRVVMYWAVLTLGPLLIGASLTITSYVVGVSLGIVQQVPGADRLMLAAVPLILTAVAFTLVYLLVPNRPVRPLHAAVGGFAAATMFEVMKRAFAFYIAQFPGYTLVYGAFAALPIFLVWLYLSWVVTLLGAVITALLPDYAHSGEAPEGASGSFRAALGILRALVGAQDRALRPDSRAVLGAAGVPWEAGQRILERLAAIGLVAPTAGEGWTLACDPDRVTLADLYRGLVFDPADGRPARTEAWCEAIVERAASGVERSLDVPLRSLLEEAAGGEATPPVGALLS